MPEETPKIHTIEMPKESDKKGSVKYSSKNPTSVVTNVYLSRSAYEEMPDKIFVTISEDPIDNVEAVPAKKSK